jgi:putative transposase
VSIRYNPSDITSLYVYTRDSAETFIATAHAQDLEAETLSLVAARASTRHLREKGKTVSNRAVLVEAIDREARLAHGKKHRQQREQEILRPRPEPVAKVVETVEEEPVSRPRVFDYQELVEDYEKY